MNAHIDSHEVVKETEKPFWHREIPTAKQVIVGELAERGEWVVANVNPGGYWPINAQKVRWRGQDIWIMPVMDRHYPAVAVKVTSGISRVGCEELLMRFISNLSWVLDRGIMVEGIGGGSLPAPMGRSADMQFAISDEFDLSYFPEPNDDKALLALALMREGRGLNHPAYAFLSFFRVLEVAIPDGRQRRGWVVNALASVSDHRVKEVINGLLAKGISDIGDHLFHSGRCAIAHANSQPIIDPDKPDDTRRLSVELPLIRALAQKAVEEELGVETSMTVYRKHLYELEGFKKILGPDVCAMLSTGQSSEEQRTVDWPPITVAIRGKATYAPLTGLVPREVTRTGPQQVCVRFGCDENDVDFRFRLDFAEERLIFDLFSDIAVGDKGSAMSARRIREVRRFEQEYFGNGQLHIVNADSGELISRKDAFLPMNMFQDKDGCDAELAFWEAQAAKRDDREQRYAAQIARNAQGYSIKIEAR